MQILSLSVSNPKNKTVLQSPKTNFIVLLLYFLWYKQKMFIMTTIFEIKFKNLEYIFVAIMLRDLPCGRSVTCLLSATRKYVIIQ